MRREVGLSTIDDDPADIAAVDAKLVRVAVDHGWQLVTTDANLEKVAGAQDVRVLNPHRLATALKPDFVAGESIELRVIKPGKERGQGVGYLDDGTMVVVDGASGIIGSTAAVEVTGMLQNPTGRMVFARIMEDGPGVRPAEAGS